MFRPLRLATLSLAVLTTASVSSANASATESSPHDSTFLSWAATPPMGWNSWDCFGTTVTEPQTKAQADFMSEHLKDHGWTYIVVDIQWYEPDAKNHAYRAGAPLTMDAYGRLQPAPNRFPSAADGAGFKALADYVHARGLKFGLHLMRGIPRQAVHQNVPILGTDGIHAQDIANTDSICPWNPDMYGVDMSKPGAQTYYNSVFNMFAEWGVDYVKVDDISRPYHDHESEIEAIRHAIDQTGRPMVLSLSPGATALSAADHVAQNANLWRISDDFWDRWLALHEQFERLANWNPHRVTGAWPDADMLPVGVLDLGRRSTRFTADEQRTMMTLWSIARSPLMHGGDMTKTDDFTLALLTNDEVLAVNQHSTNNRPLFDHDELIAWVADVPNDPAGAKYLAVFNARDRVRLLPEYADFISEPITAGQTEPLQLDLDVTGGTQVILTNLPGWDGPGQNPLVFSALTAHFADGRTVDLTAQGWSAVDSPWDAAGQHDATADAPARITMLAPSKVAFDLPTDATRFTATVHFEHPKGAQEETLRLVAVVARATNTDTRASVPIPVDLNELGLNGPVAIRDLWTHQDLGEQTGTFAPEVPFHGAGLYRLTPQ
ncbi:glycoside hydrolase family 27 protein [Actomonas aquatica]|uniref:Alpha-galactosidase n=1 Tax=Actomonas aquatica TaxID=2866162 RepID=A0ABZ1CEG4_9BACT|nr:glycoside hydrolase family 27 protein [Opitutus sp. WL0086]WRQ89944.1 glycoside hydrolase family 27 protein [Opitutus sp. WL0086]